MSHHINWDVCPEWVRFKERAVHQNDDVVLADEQVLKEHHRKHRDIAGVTSEAIPLPNRNHFHKVYFEDEPRRIERATGPAIRVGRCQHIHYIKER